MLRWAVVWAVVWAVCVAAAAAGDGGGEALSLARCGLAALDAAPCRLARRAAPLPRALDLSRNALRDAAGLGPLARDLRGLDLRANAVATVSTRWLGGLRQLRTLDLSSNAVSAVEPGAFAGLAHLRWLNLSSNRLAAVPKGAFAGLAALATLDLSANALRGLGDGVGAAAPALRVLRLARNQLTALLPSWFHGMAALATLDLAHNNVSALENGTLASLTSLRELSLSNNSIDILYEECFAGLENLEALDLSFNVIAFLENGTLAHLVSLRTLNLRGNKIEVLCDTCFAGLTALESLDLSENRISTLENGTFAPLTSLLRLNLSRNRLEGLEKDFFAGLSSLIVLDLSFNALSQLENGTLSPLESLLRLELRGNRVAALGEECFAGLGRLQRLDVSENALKVVWPGVLAPLAGLTDLAIAGNPLHPQHLLPGSRRLQHVDASRTRLAVVPAALTRSVRTLVLAGNAVAAVRCGDLDSYPLLRVLSLSDNRVAEVEDDALGRLEALDDLRLDGNALAAVPRSLPASLATLHLHRNNITALRAADLQGLPRLRELSLRACHLASIEAGTFAQLFALDTLDLSENPLVALSPEALAGPGRLKILRLAYLHRLKKGDASAAAAGQFPAPAPERLEVLDLDGSPVLASQLLGDAAALAAIRQLRELSLRRANVTLLRADVLRYAPRLASLRLAGNALRCTDAGDALALGEWLRRQEEGDEEELRAAVCASPPALRGRPVAELGPGDFNASATAGPPDPACPQLEALCREAAETERPTTTTTTAAAATTTTTRPQETSPSSSTTTSPVSTPPPKSTVRKRPSAPPAVIRVITSNRSKSPNETENDTLKKQSRTDKNTTAGTFSRFAKQKDKMLLNITVLHSTAAVQASSQETPAVSLTVAETTSFQNPTTPAEQTTSQPRTSSAAVSNVSVAQVMQQKTPVAPAKPFSTTEISPTTSSFGLRAQTNLKTMTTPTTPSSPRPHLPTSSRELKPLIPQRPLNKTRIPTPVAIISTVAPRTSPASVASTLISNGEHKPFDTIMRDKVTTNGESADKAASEGPLPAAKERVSSQSVSSFIVETSTKLQQDHDLRKGALTQDGDIPQKDAADPSQPSGEEAGKDPRRRLSLNSNPSQTRSAWANTPLAGSRFSPSRLSVLDSKPASARASRERQIPVYSGHNPGASVKVPNLRASSWTTLQEKPATWDSPSKPFISSSTASSSSKMEKLPSEASRSSVSHTGHSNPPGRSGAASTSTGASSARTSAPQELLPAGDVNPENPQSAQQDSPAAGSSPEAPTGASQEKSAGVGTRTEILPVSEENPHPGSATGATEAWRGGESLLLDNSTSPLSGRPAAARAAQRDAPPSDGGGSGGGGGGAAGGKGSHPGMFVLLGVGLALAAALATTISHCAKRRRRRAAVEYSRQQDIEVRSMSSIGDLW